MTPGGKSFKPLGEIGLRGRSIRQRRRQGKSKKNLRKCLTPKSSPALIPLHDACAELFRQAFCFLGPLLGNLMGESVLVIDEAYLLRCMSREDKVTISRVPLYVKPEFAWLLAAGVSPDQALLESCWQAAGWNERTKRWAIRSLMADPEVRQEVERIEAAAIEQHRRKEVAFLMRGEAGLYAAVFPEAV